MPKGFSRFPTSTMLTLHLLLQDCKESIFLCISRCFDCQLSLFGKGNPTIQVYNMFGSRVDLSILKFIMFKALNLLIKFQVALIVTTDSCWLCNCSFWKKFFWYFWVWFWLQHLSFSRLVSSFFIPLLHIYLPSKPYDKWKKNV